MLHLLPWAAATSTIGHGVRLGPWKPCRCGVAPLADCSPLATCQNVSVPLSYDQLDGPWISVHVTRIAASSNGVPTEPSHGSLWWFNGGPAFTPLSPLVTRPEFEQLTLQYRGLKWSTPLECSPGDEGEVGASLARLPACASHINATFPNGGARHFTVANAARDYDAVMRAYDKQREDGGHQPYKKHAYAVSFGTYAFQKFLQVKTVKLEAGVMDSVFASHYGSSESFKGRLCGAAGRQ